MGRKGKICKKTQQGKERRREKVKYNLRAELPTKRLSWSPAYQREAACRVSSELVFLCDQQQEESDNLVSIRHKVQGEEHNYLQN